MDLVAWLWLVSRILLSSSISMLLKLTKTKDLTIVLLAYRVQNQCTASSRKDEVDNDSFTDVLRGKRQDSNARQNTPQGIRFGDIASTSTAKDDSFQN